MPFSIPSSQAFPWDVDLTRHLAQLSNSVQGGINHWSVIPTVGVDGAPLGVDHTGYTGIDTLNSSLIRWDGSGWISLMDGYKLVTGPQLNVYVNQVTGSDTNDGKTASTAWKTISKFYQEVNKYNLLSKQVNLYLGAGTYNIKFPPPTWGGVIRVIGASSATVTIQYMTVIKATHVMIQDVTLGFPQLLDSQPFFWPVTIAESSVLQLGPNVVLGQVGNYSSGSARFHISASNSQVQLIAGLPVTLTGSVNNVFNLGPASTLWVSTYYASGGGGVVSPNTAPEVDTGAVYNYLPSPGSSDTKAWVNAIGSVTVGNFINLGGGSAVNGPPGWQLGLSGSVVGSAYALTDGSSINGYLSKGPNSQGIDYPISISSGTKDGTSTIGGTSF